MLNLKDKITASVTLSENDVMEIVAEYLTENSDFKFKPEDIHLVVDYQWRSLGENEYPKTYFKHCIAVTKGEELNGES